MDALLINCSHALTEAQQKRIAELIGRRFEVVDCRAQFDDHAPLGPQVAGLLDGLGLEAGSWQSRPIVLIPPALAPACATVLAELHGRMGHFPALIRISPERAGGLTTFVVEEILDLDSIRLAARARRTSP